MQAALLTGLAAVADRFQFHLTQKTSINVATVCLVTMILVLPAGLPGLLALLAILAGHALRRADPVEAAVCFAALSDGNEYVALAAAAAILHVVNTALVAVAAGLHLGTGPLRSWLVTFADDLTAQVALTLLGVVAATVAADRPLLLPAPALPVVLVHRAQQQTVRLGTDTREALTALVDVVELRDPYTAGHSRRVAALARAIAFRLGLTHEEADLIEGAGRVHDIGKVAIDPAVLTKPGSLDDGEWREMRRHPGYGADVIARFSAYPEGYPLVRHHHEAWDGSGYPDGLVGEAIPLGVRIPAVADTFDVLPSDRPYRRGMGVGRALEILQEGAGRQWDAPIVAALAVHLAAAAETSSTSTAAAAAAAPA